ncbi:antibiotic biosynthesis monooxygenase [Blastococcus colisei]|uniref:Antibiotic biosynthesis monooxygenase n=1 Tax=Blastococcus colisei TaxID=1564162 RepID=A0A543PFJ3_9ACTN|nr:antibiotic biosynthesis monooxygenase [Blastococcus colisei]TQN42838.1 antibiotic biosynthesis monooxygenase [Blastococcus colisei]
MYARSTTIRGNTRAVEEGIAVVRTEDMPAVRQLDGCIGLSMLADRESGRCIVTTSWRDEAAMRASEDAVRASQQRTIEVLGGTSQVDEWEIAAMHRVHDSHHGACSRVTWTRTAPEDVDKAVDAVRLSLMPKLDDLPGFCSVSVMVRRSEGIGVATVSYDSWSDLEEAAEGAREFREEFGPSLGIEVTDTAEFDLSIAELRVPESS